MRNPTEIVIENGETQPRYLPLDIGPSRKRTKRRLIPKLLRVAGRIPFADDLAAAWYAAIDPATSSLELRPDGTMLVSGTLSDVTGRPFPAMWTFDAGTAAFNWAWVPDVEDGAGHSAIPQGPRLHRGDPGIQVVDGAQLL